MLWFPILLIAFTVTAVGAGLSLIVVGLPTFEAVLILTRVAANRHRVLADRISGAAPMPDQHRPVPDVGWLLRLRARAEDSMTWRELLRTLAAATVGLPCR